MASTSRQAKESCALTMLDDSVKKKKSPKSSPVPVHSKSLVDSALSLLIDWLYKALGTDAILVVIGASQVLI